MTAWATWTTPGVITSGPGVRTKEVGLITGDLTVHTTWVEGQAYLTVQYTGALDWYKLEGSPVPAPDEARARTVHQETVRAARGDADTPGHSELSL